MTQHFISHNALDAETAARLRHDLLACRPDDVVALSSDPGGGPQGGTAWQSWIRRTLQSADVVLFLASERSLSPWCSAELGMARLLDTPIITLLTAPDAVVNPVVAHLQAVLLDQPIEELVCLVDALVGTPASEPTAALRADLVPYPGLAPLTEEHEALLQGRAVERDRILGDLDRLATGQARFVVVSGPSGSGKSSLARAGVVPRLKAAGWSVTGPTQPRQLRLRGIPPLDGPEGSPSVVVVDQFEELVELDDEARERILRWLHDVVADGTSAVLVVRSEFRTAIGEWIPKPIDHYVPFLAIEDLYDIVRVPAKLAQLDVPEQLVDRLVHETGSGSALPLLAFTLHELWEARDRVEVALQESALDRLGGVRGVLAHRADEALRAASDGDSAAADLVLALLSRLASPDANPPTRSPLRVRTITEQEREWLDEFVHVGLVSYRTSYALDDRLDAGVRPTGDDLADVTHEALFAWPPLAATIDAQRANNQMRIEIERSARRWDESERRDDSLLLGGDRLASARRTGVGASDPVLHDYVAASLRHDRDRRVRRALAVVVAVVAALAVTAAAVALVQRNEADAARRDAEEARVLAQSVRVAAQANQEIAAQRDVALVTAAVAHSIDANPDTEGALTNALATPGGPVRYFASDAADWPTLRMLPDGTAVVASSSLRPAAVDLVTRATTELAAVDLEVEDLQPGVDGDHVIVHGRVPPESWAVALVDRRSASVSAVEHGVEITAAAGHGAGVVFGDADGGVWFAPLDAGVLGEPMEIDRHGDTSITDVSVAGHWLATASRRGIRVQQHTGVAWGAPIDVLVVSPGTRAAERVVLRPSADEPELYAAGSDPAVRHWVISGGDAVERRSLGRHAGVVNALAVDPSGAVLFTGGRGGQIQRWDLPTGAPLGEPLAAHRSQVRHLSAASPTSMVSTADDVAILWDLAPTRVVERDGVVPPAWRGERFVALVSGDGPLAAVTLDGQVLVDDGRVLAAPPGTRRAWWTVGGGLVVETGDTNQLDMPPLDVWVVDPSGAERIASADAVDVGRCLVATASGPTISFAAPVGEVAGCGPVPEEIRLERGDVADLALSPDEQQVLVVYRDNEIEVRGIDGEVMRSVARRHGIVPTSAEWVSSDRVAIGHDVGAAIELVDVAAGEVVEVGTHDDAVWWLEVDVAGGRLVSAGQDGLIVRTDLERAAPVGAPMVGARRIEENDPAAAIRGLRLLDGGVLLAIHGERLVAWEVDPMRLRDRACHDADRAVPPAELARLGADPNEPPCR